ncbi:DUF3152 domain-containing protein [Streptomyces griseorubiginosus]|uniref:DUF3152 domain-containing protein n=1 Tax=Streptomyces griseorubiginosus TaxID=67304 RepID=UPI00114077D3|nr:DUF3152 domain-containing protein [Streptomyces griseorubiginosus]
MGRHSRRGPAPKKGSDNSGSSDGDRAVQTGPGPVPGAGTEVPGGRARNLSQAGTPAPGGTGRRVPAQGGPRLPEGTPAHGFPRLPEGTPARGLPRLPDGTPAHGFPRIADGTPAQGTPRARGGHPEQRESGGGWGAFDGRGPGAQAAGGPGGVLPRQRQGQRQQAAGTRQGPRQDYLDAFTDDTDLFAPGAPKGRPGRGQREGHGPRPGAGTSVAAHPSDPYGSYGSVTDWPDDTSGGVATGAGSDGTPPVDAPPSAKGGKGRTFTGVAAAAVVTVLAVVVAGQVTGERDTAAGSSAATDQARDARDTVTAGRPTPSGSPSVATLTYEQAMGTKYPLSAKLDGSGKFDAVPGVDKAPGKGQKYTYRVDVEQGLGLDGALFAEAVQKTLNDDRSWAHGGARTFERVYTGKPDFVITLASPGTTADWCAKSGLDTTEDNVSCDSAATERVMINAYRWAQGSITYGDRIHAYRQMLINHEVGHRLGYSHVTCDKNGELAPVMQQQTKFLDHDGIHCRPNPWPYPGS